MNINELIEQGETFQIKHQEGCIIPAGYGMLKQIRGFSYLEKADEFATWIQKCIRFLAQNFPKDFALEEFRNVNIEDLTQGKIFNLVGILKSLKENPIICEIPTPQPMSMHNITLNQNQSQTQNNSVMIDILREELKGKEFSEIEKIMSSNLPMEDKKDNITSKLMSFGENVLAGIIASLITTGIK